LDYAYAHVRDCWMNDDVKCMYPLYAHMGAYIRHIEVNVCTYGCIHRAYSVNIFTYGCIHRAYRVACVYAYDHSYLLFFYFIYFCFFHT
jgi:hypothetical protein